MEIESGATLDTFKHGGMMTPDQRLLDIGGLIEAMLY